MEPGLACAAPEMVLRALYREMLVQAADLEDRLSHKGCQQATTCDWPGRGDDTAQYVAPDGVGSAPMSGRWRRKGHRVGGEDCSIAPLQSSLDPPDRRRAATAMP